MIWFRIGPRGGPADRKSRERVNGGANKCPLEQTHAQHTRKALFSGPFLRLDHFADASSKFRIADPDHPTAKALQRFKRLKAEKTGVAEGSEFLAALGSAQTVRAI